ncbi:MAG TPA: VOC family protein [Kiloniellaceae bacterium]
MPLSRLDHVNLRTAELAAMQTFYSEVLGMSLGPRPPFSFDGAWLYCGGQATVHLVEVPRRPAPEGELRLEHFAFAAEGLAEFLALLRRRGLPYRIGVLPALGTVQVNLHDPDGNHIHVDFAAAEAASVPEEPALAKATAGT